MSTIDSKDWERILDGNGGRVTIRVPNPFVQQMEVKARMSGRSLNEEYGRAIETWCGDGYGWTRLLLPADQIHEWVTPEIVQGEQLSPILVDRLVRDGVYIGLGLGFYRLTINRQWFVSDEAFDQTRSAVANHLPKMIEVGPEPGLWPTNVRIVTYGRLGPRCRKVGCMSDADQAVTLNHMGSDGVERSVDVPLCRQHVFEAVQVIMEGQAPMFRIG